MLINLAKYSVSQETRALLCTITFFLAAPASQPPENNKHTWIAYSKEMLT